MGLGEYSHDVAEDARLLQDLVLSRYCRSAISSHESVNTRNVTVSSRIEDSLSNRSSRRGQRLTGVVHQVDTG
jgi:hypothetical protein